jgi:4'-phosphopantetheinyl transferase
MIAQGLARVEVAYLFTDGLDAADLRRLEQGLNAEEAARAAGFGRPERRLAFAAAHALLQDRLGAATGGRPWRTRAEPGGRPVLEPPHGDPPLRFSLSHTDGLVAVALARGGEVGVDVERLDERLELASLAGSIFSPAELRAFVAAPPHAAARHVLQVWTAKEAVLKTAGVGLARAPETVSIRLHPPGVSSAAPLPVTGDWSLHWRALPRHTLCVAACSPFPVEAEIGECSLSALLARSPG